MLRICVIDADPDCASRVLRFTKEALCEQTAQVDWYSGDGSLAQALNGGMSYDIVATDIALGSEGHGGIDIVERYFPASAGAQVIYMTDAPDRYHSMVYRTDHVYFLVKPFTIEEFSSALSRALDKLEAFRCRPLRVRTVNGERIVYPDQILYIESIRRKTHVVTVDDDFVANASASSILRELPSPFVQCHKSYAVNLRHMEAFDRRTVLLANGARVPISQSRRAFLRERVEAFSRSVGSR